jgi:hypothetical protein
MLVGYQFDRAKVTALSDSSLLSFLSRNQSFVVPNRGNEMNVTTSALSCLIDTGQALIQGRLVEVLSPETVAIPANTSGYLVLHIDLSQVNTSIGVPGSSDYKVINNQVKAKFVNQLIYDDLNNGGVDYSFNLGAVSSTNSTVTFTQNDEAWTSAHQFINTEWQQISNMWVYRQGNLVSVRYTFTPTSSSNVILGTLPPELRPAVNLMLQAVSWDTSNSTNAKLQIDAGNGDVMLVNPVGGFHYASENHFTL